MRNCGDNNSCYRDLVTGVDDKIRLYNKALVTGINFDNAATTPPFKNVMNDINSFIPSYSSIHRGEGYNSQLCTKYYDTSRIVVGNFVKFDTNKMDIIYTKNCSESINRLCNLLYEYYKCENKCCNTPVKDTILTTFMEHHSNDLPWRTKFKMLYTNVDDCGILDMDDFKEKLECNYKNIALVTVSGASNVTGHKNPIYEIAALAHKYGIKVLVDCAQLAPHSPLDMKPYNSYYHIDFIAFSAHKMYAPFGCGVLIGPKDFFNTINPDYTGGGTIKFVTPDTVIYDNSPARHEAGTPNVIGTLALTSAIKTLSRIGMENIEGYERYLLQVTTEGLLKIQNVRLYGNYDDYTNKVSIISFNIGGIHHNMVARILSYEFGIAVRSGCFCAQPYMQKLLHMSEKEIKENMRLPKDMLPGTVRVSFGMYNTICEVEKFLYAVDCIAKRPNYYINKFYGYNNAPLV